ncbi:amino acid transport GAP1 [Fusarium beomiforme]|uniref:Amino acid transport GAP1 n=1 Tax=Fusarium beomiforme TaxID=44412 RepID=A0A9P5APT9_9HYPO|nr:amino acid transport GAP1 [Fusarium beomiforme]
MSHDKPTKTTDIKVEVALTRDVEIIEMRNMSNGSHKDENPTTWAISAPKPEEIKEQNDWLDGFRRADRRKMKKGWDRQYHSEQKPHVPGDRYFDIRAANAKTATSALARELKGRHLQMIAFGGAIGTGLFITSGSALHQGGPGSVLLSYIVIGALQYCTMQSLAELCVIFPIAGSFSAFSTRFLDPSWGFSMGWNYYLQWLFTLPLEIIAGAFTITYWNESISKSVFVAIFLAAIFIINLFGVKAYGEAEFVFSIIKVTAIVAFILLGIVINIGGEPTSGYIGGRYWIDPGLFSNGFKGFCSVLVTSCFSFTGTELIGLAAAETANPRKSLPSAIKQVFWRITLFYIVALMLVSLLVPHNDPRILDASSSNSAASPFVIAIETAGTTVLPSVMNAVILIAVISVGNSSVFGSSRTLAALADQSMAPAIFSYVDKQGRPLAAIIFSCCIGLLAFIADLKAHDVVFNWLLSISSLATLFTWGSICLTHIRFRNAWAHASHTLEQLPFRSRPGTIGSWFALAGYALVLLSQVWIAIDPVEHKKNETTNDIVQNIFLNLMAVPIVLIMYLGHKLWYRTNFVALDDIDIQTGRRYYRVHLMSDQEREARVSWPLWKRAYRYFC